MEKVLLWALLILFAAQVSCQGIRETQYLSLQQTKQDILDDIRGKLIKLATPKVVVKTGFFEQRTDHFGRRSDLVNVTFQQYYAMIDDFYKVGGPVFLLVSGEAALDESWVSQRMLPRQLAERYGGILITLEHRFYGPGNVEVWLQMRASVLTTLVTAGRSVPTADLSNNSLRSLLVSDQAIEDLAKFVSSFPATFPEYSLGNNTKWFVIGGSYAGNLAAWLIDRHPDLIFAAHASSAPVMATQDFWRYSFAVDEGMTHFAGSSACMQGWTRAVRAFDEHIASLRNDPARLAEFKSRFWLSQVESLGDIGMVVTQGFSSTVQYAPQYNYLINPNDTSGDPGLTFLDALCDGRYFPAFTDRLATADQLLESLQKLTIQYLALQAGIQSDKDPNAAMLATTSIDDRSFDNSWFLWYYQSCNEFGYSLTAQSVDPQKNQLVENWSVYSQALTLEYQKSWCVQTGLAETATGAASVQRTNAKYGGLNVNASRVLWINGALDPWRWLSNYGTSPDPRHKVMIFANATHCSDLYGPQKTSSDYENKMFADVFAVYDEWMAEREEETPSVETPKIDIPNTETPKLEVSSRDFPLVLWIAISFGIAAPVLAAVAFLRWRHRKPVESRAAGMEKGEEEKNTENGK
ncbi:hypothetical protein HDU81_004799 [Chytriomyces hyalinus]|nr:hypothetical protein HDU81_004799 [Chytriomyces hyalinus]